MNSTGIKNKRREDDIDSVLDEITIALKNMTQEDIKIPSLFIVTEDFNLVSKYANRYSNILDESNYFPERGRGTFCELTFPKDNEKDEKLFYSSPRRVSATRNRFFGTMSISLQEYDGRDLMDSRSYRDLMSFIELNKDNIQYVIHVLPNFSMKRQLYSSLSAITPFKLINASLIEDRLGVIKEEFDQRGYYCDDAVLDSVNHIWDGIDPENVLSINALMSRIDYEMSLNDGINVIQDVIAKIEREYSDNVISDESIKMGFRPC